MNDVEITPARYQRKPFRVDAVQVTATNFLAVARWANGTITNNDPKKSITTNAAGFNPGEQHIKVTVLKPTNVGRETRAHVGDWILKSDRTGFRVWRNEAFLQAFEAESQDTAQPDRAEKLSNKPVPESEFEATRGIRAEDRTERIGEDAVRSAPSSLTGNPMRDLQTERNLKAAAEAGGYPTSDDPIPGHTVLTTDELNAALAATGVRTAKSRVCDLALEQEFVYEGVLLKVIIKTDGRVEAQGALAEDITIARLFINPDSVEALDEGELSWLLEVIIDDPSETDKAIHTLEEAIRLHHEGAEELVPAGGGESVELDLIDLSAIEMEIGDDFLYEGTWYAVEGKDSSAVTGVAHETKEVVYFANPDHTRPEGQPSWNAVVQMDQTPPVDIAEVIKDAVDPIEGAEVVADPADKTGFVEAHTDTGVDINPGESAV